MYVALHEVTWCMVVWCTQNLRRDGSSFMRHQPCQRCKYTATSVDIHKRAIKSSHSCRITCERSESARERRIALYKSNHHELFIITQQCMWTSEAWPCMDTSLISTVITGNSVNLHIASLRRYQSDLSCNDIANSVNLHNHCITVEISVWSEL